MIGKLKGTIDEIGDDHVLIDVRDVCYVVFCPTRTLAGLGPAGEPATLYIETFVREDQLKLYGFASAVEREWFRLLQSVQGVGAKVALAVLSTLSVADLANAIALQDKAMVARTPGIGPKVAQRIVTELKTKAPSAADDVAAAMGFKAAVGDGLVSGPVGDAVSALSNLGYSRDQAAQAVSAALKVAGESADSAALIRQGLKELAP